MCLSNKTPKYEEPLTVEAPEPNKAPQKLETEDSVDPEKKALKAKKRGTKALRTDLGGPDLTGGMSGGSGLFIPRT